MTASCKTVVQCDNQDFDIDAAKIQNISITTGFLMLSIYGHIHFLHTLTPSLTLVTIDMFSFLYFCHFNNYVCGASNVYNLWYWLLSFSISFWILILILVYVSDSSLFIEEQDSMSWVYQGLFND